MNPIINYIKENSKGFNYPISSNLLTAVFNTSGIEIRRLINEARCSGEPICSCGKGYYYSEKEEDIIRTIDSLQGRIAKQEKAISGLKNCLA